MSASVELQKAIYDALMADSGVYGLVSDRIYDNVPNAATFPYISFGPTQEIADDEEGIDGEEHLFQVDVWDRSQGRLVIAKRITAAVKAALHDADLEMAAPYAAVFTRVRETRTFLDQDGITAHGIVSVAAMVEI